MAESGTPLNLVTGVIITAILATLGFFAKRRINEQSWRKDNILVPMFNEVSVIVEKKGWTLYPEIVSNWGKFDSYSRLRIDDKLRQKLDSYVLKLEEYKRTATTAFKTLERHGQRLATAITGALAPLKVAYFGTDYSGRNTHILVFEWGADKQSPRVSSSVDKLVETYAHVLVSAQDANEAKHGMIDFSASARDGWHQYFREWDSAVFQALYSSAKSIDLGEDRKAVERLIRSKEEVLGLATELKSMLQDRTKKYW